MTAYHHFASAPHEPDSARKIEELWSARLHMDIALSERASSFEMRSHSETDLSISSFSGATASMTRTAEQAARFSDDVVLCVCPDARVRIVARNGQERLFEVGERESVAAAAEAEAAKRR